MWGTARTKTTHFWEKKKDRWYSACGQTGYKVPAPNIIKVCKECARIKKVKLTGE